MYFFVASSHQLAGSSCKTMLPDCTGRLLNQSHLASVAHPQSRVAGGGGSCRRPGDGSRRDGRAPAAVRNDGTTGDPWFLGSRTPTGSM